MRTLRLSAAIATVAAGLGTAVSAGAAPINQFSQLVDLTSPACASLGDFISCSAPYLNVLSGQAQGTGSFTPIAAQGQLQLSIVLGTGAGGQIPNNTDIGSGVDNAFDTPNNNPSFSTVTAPDPTGAPIGDTANSWDINLQTLIDALTSNGTRRNMFIMFDHNQQGGTALEQSLDIWSLVVVRDVNGNQPDIVFELNPDDSGPTNFTSTKTFDDYIGNATSNPAAGDFVTSSAVICLDAANNAIAALPGSGASCPPGTVTEIDNNLGTNRAEFINSIPELDSQLEALLAAGYDTISVRYDINRNNGGYDDIYILAGQFETTEEVPEPSAIASLGAGLLALGGLGWARRRRI
jgi:hypothetical protein